jgi:hypothetical protein
MNSNRKYFGMTTSQLGIVGGLAGVLCLILLVGGWFILGGGLNTASPQQIPTTVNLTATLIVPPTFTPTTAPTAIPYEQLIPTGWKQHKTVLAEIWLPPTYKTAKLENFEGSPGFVISPELVLSQPASGGSAYNEWFVIEYEPLTGDSLDSHLDTQIQELPPDIRLVERNREFLNSTEVIRLVFETRLEGNVDAKILTYVFLDGNTIWYVEYFAQINEFFNLLETFKQSAQTFRVVK